MATNNSHTEVVALDMEVPLIKEVVAMEDSVKASNSPHTHHTAALVIATGSHQQASVTTSHQRV